VDRLFKKSSKGINNWGKSCVKIFHTEQLVNQSICLAISPAGKMSYDKNLPMEQAKPVPAKAGNDQAHYVMHY